MNHLSIDLPLLQISMSLRWNSIIAERLLIIADDKEKKDGLSMDGEPDWISRMAEEQVIIRQSSGEEADRSSSEGAPEEDSVSS